MGYEDEGIAVVKGGQAEGTPPLKGIIFKTKELREEHFVTC
jgi:hypothetical protein